MTKEKMFRRRSGFTLIELLIVILIISVLMGFAVQGIQSVREKANIAAVTMLIDSLNNGLKQYKSEYSYLPGRDSPADPYLDESNVISEVYDELQGQYVEIKEKDVGVEVPGKKMPEPATKQQINDDSVDKIIMDIWGQSLVARENQSKMDKQDHMHNQEFMDVYSLGINGEDDTIEMKSGSENDDLGNW